MSIESAVSSPSFAQNRSSSSAYCLARISRTTRETERPSACERLRSHSATSSSTTVTMRGCFAGICRALLLTSRVAPVMDRALPRREVKDRTRDDEEQRKWKVGGELPDQESPPPGVTRKVVPLNWLRGTPGISIPRAV